MSQIYEDSPEAVDDMGSHPRQGMTPAILLEGFRTLAENAAEFGMAATFRAALAAVSACTLEASILAAA
jgi:hypothetical protein